jgi:hypothetical protein
MFILKFTTQPVIYGTNRPSVIFSTALKCVLNNFKNLSKFLKKFEFSKSSKRMKIT